MFIFTFLQICNEKQIISSLFTKTKMHLKIHDFCENNSILIEFAIVKRNFTNFSVKILCFEVKINFKEACFRKEHSHMHFIHISSIFDFKK